MSFRDTLRNRLGSELFTQVVDALGDDFNFDLVPRKRLNDVIRQRNELQEKLDNLGVPQTQGADGEGKPSAGQQPAPAQQQPQQPATAIDETALRQQYEQEKNTAIQELRIQYAGLDALRNAGAVDPDLAFTLLDKSKLTLGEDGKLSGCDEQIEALKTSKGFLFGASGGRNNTPGGTGKEGGSERFEKVTTKEDFLKMPTADQAAFKEAHPDVFKRFLNEF